MAFVRRWKCFRIGRAYHRSTLSVVNIQFLTVPPHLRRSVGWTLGMLLRCERVEIQSGLPEVTSKLFQRRCSVVLFDFLFLPKTFQERQKKESTYAYRKKLLPSSLLHGSLPSCIPPLPPTTWLKTEGKKRPWTPAGTNAHRGREQQRDRVSPAPSSLIELPLSLPKAHAWAKFRSVGCRPLVRRGCVSPLLFGI